MSGEEGRGWATLYENVVSKGVCTGCGVCIISCPHDVLSYTRLDGSGYEGPVAPSLPPFRQDYCPISETLGCSFCSQACSRLDPSLHGDKLPPIEPNSEGLGRALERFILGRSRSPEEEVGVYRSLMVARSISNKVLSVSPDGFGGLKVGQSFAQDGGVATAILVWALKNNFIDGAIVSSSSRSYPWLAEPVVATDIEKVISCAGVHGYTYSPNPLGLSDALEKGLRRLAFVALPCQLQSMRKMQWLLSSNDTDPAFDDRVRERLGAVRLTIGLLCAESFTYDLIKRKIEREAGIDLRDIAKINIKRRLLIYLKSGEVREIGLKDIKSYARRPCKICKDFSAELADIAVGGLGLEGWTVTMARTKVGEEVLEGALKDGYVEARKMEDFKDTGAYELLVRTAKKHRARTE